MLQEHDIMPHLLEACPEYAPLLNEYLRDQAAEGRTERLTYNEVGNFAEWLVEKVADGATHWVQPVANKIEVLLVNGDPLTCQIAQIGLVEDIQEGCVSTTVDPDLFMKALGPVGRAKWLETVRWKFPGLPEHWRAT